MREMNPMFWQDGFGDMVNKFPSWALNGFVGVQMIMYTSCIILYIMSYNVQIDEVYQNKTCPPNPLMLLQYVILNHLEWIFGMYCSNIYPYLSNLEIHGQIYSLVQDAASH